MTRTTRRVWLGAALFCWLVMLVLVVAHPTVDFEGGDTERCDDAAIVHALADDGRCGLAGARRVQVLVTWVVLTAPVTLGYVAARGRPDLPAE